MPDQRKMERKLKRYRQFSIETSAIMNQSRDSIDKHNTLVDKCDNLNLKRKLNIVTSPTD